MEELEKQVLQTLATVQRQKAAQMEARRQRLEAQRREEEERRRRTRECVVCMEASIQVVFVPCGHIVCCAGCAEQVQSCPSCRADIV